MVLMKTLNGYEICDEVARATAANAKSLASEHNHTINNVNGLQSALDGKADSSHWHTNLAYAGYLGEYQNWNDVGDGVWLVGQSTFYAEYNQPAGAYPYGLLRVYNNGSNITQIYTAHYNGQMWFRERWSSSNDFSTWAMTYTTVSKPSLYDLGIRNKTLWEGAYGMSASQTATLWESVSSQPHGIILVFSSYYEGTVENQYFSTYFVPKWMVVQGVSQHGMCFNPMANVSFQYKYLFIGDTTITGHGKNWENPTQIHGRSTNNQMCLLRWVIGV